MANKSPALRQRQRWLDYPLQGALVWMLFTLFRLLPVDWASGLAGRIMRHVGPRLGASRKARENLRRAMPDLDAETERRIIAGMWENLGRVAAEYPHIRTLASDGRHLEVIGAEHLEPLRDESRGAIIVSGHFANWELLPSVASRHGLRVTLIFRRPNNPFVAALIDKARAATNAVYVPKGREGARALKETLAVGGSVGLLVDQKLNKGLPIPFFGHEAMTPPAAAQLALRYGAPLIPARIERVSGTRFRVRILPPLVFSLSGDREADTRAILMRINGLLEDWIREKPEQWLWLHRRWPRRPQ